MDRVTTDREIIQFCLSTEGVLSTQRSHAGITADDTLEFVEPGFASWMCMNLNLAHVCWDNHSTFRVGPNGYELHHASIVKSRSQRRAVTIFTLIRRSHLTRAKQLPTDAELSDSVVALT